MATPKQIKARERNWKIFQLRNMYHSANRLMSLERAGYVQRFIDTEIEKLGAETEFSRYVKLVASYRENNMAIIENELGLKSVENLLDLEPDDWCAIAKMSDEELGIYLKDITNLEPECIVNPERQIVGRKDQDSDEEEETADDEKPLKKAKTTTDANPFKTKKPRTASKIQKRTSRNR